MVDLGHPSLPPTDLGRLDDEGVEHHGLGIHSHEKSVHYGLYQRLSDNTTVREGSATDDCLSQLLGVAKCCFIAVQYPTTDSNNQQKNALQAETT
ncbi:hypothetical protein TNCV_733761 [Trichonephila clavipes]|nr:hypothetical protein TNCV_733761 [Trichonephila clavipes]